MKKLKNYLYVFLLLSVGSQVLPADDFEKQGVTKLAEYLKQRDNHQRKLQSDVEKLWDECFYTTVNVTYSYNTTTTTTTYKPRLDCPYFKFRQLYENRQELKKFRDDTKKQIGQIMNEGVSINASDDHGKTALNYVQSRDQYNALRQCGADFQVDAFVKVNQFQLIVMAMLAAAWGYLLTDAINVTVVEKKKSSLIDADINLRDEKGRTSLMNFIIKQEEIIDRDREHISNLYGIDYYHERVLSIILKTNEEISRMVECGADLSMKDYDGKTVMDYCKTSIIYEHLRSLGGDFNLRNWAYVNAGYVIPCLGISAFILAMIKLSTFEFSLNSHDNIGKQFDEQFSRFLF